MSDFVAWGLVVGFALAWFWLWWFSVSAQAKAGAIVREAASKAQALPWQLRLALWSLGMAELPPEPRPPLPPPPPAPPAPPAPLGVDNWERLSLAEIELINLDLQLGRAFRTTPAWGRAPRGIQ